MNCHVMTINLWQLMIIRVQTRAENHKLMTINGNGSNYYWTDFSTASKSLNLNNPILSDQRERSVGAWNTLSTNVSKRRHIDAEASSHEKGTHDNHYWTSNTNCHVMTINSWQLMIIRVKKSPWILIALQWLIWIIIGDCLYRQKSPPIVSLHQNTCYIKYYSPVGGIKPVHI